MDMVNRFDVCLVPLDPTRGSEIQKTRPCVIVSPDEMNAGLNTVIIAPLTSTIKHYPFRVHCTFQDQQGQIALDQIRTINKKRLHKTLGALDHDTGQAALAILQEMFSP
jgi:mRNA interferase MazF